MRDHLFESAFLILVVLAALTLSLDAQAQTAYPTREPRPTASVPLVEVRDLGHDVVRVVDYEFGKWCVKTTYAVWCGELP